MCGTSLEVETIMMQQKKEIHSWQCSKGLQMLGLNLPSFQLFCTSVLKSGVRHQKTNGRTVRNVGCFPWKLGYFSLLFFILAQAEDFLKDSRLDSGKEFLRGKKE